MQVSWINPDEVASLADSLRPRPPKSPNAVASGLSLFEAGDMTALKEALGEFGIEIEKEAAVQDAPGEAAIEETPVEDPKAVEQEHDHADEQLHAEEDEVHGQEEEVTPAAEAAPVVEVQVGPDLNALRQRLQEIRERAVDAGLLPPPQVMETPAVAPEIAAAPAASAKPAPTARRSVRALPFEVPLGSVMARLEAFALWARRGLGTDDVFVVDDRGDLLWGPQEQAGLILSTLMAVNAASRCSALSACEGAHVIHQDLPSGMTATIIPCETRLGLIQVAVAAAGALADEETELVRAALTAAMDADEPERT